MKSLVPVKAEHADALYPLLKESSVTDTLLWDDPSSVDDLLASLREREERTARGEMHQFTIVDASHDAIGSADIRVEGDGVGEIGLWIGEPYQGKGIGTEVVRELTRYGFEHVHLDKITAHVFVGNLASRRIFEKSGYALTDIECETVTKRGKKIDSWVMTLTAADWRESANDRD